MRRYIAELNEVKATNIQTISNAFYKVLATVAKNLKEKAIPFHDFVSGEITGKKQAEGEKCLFQSV